MGFESKQFEPWWEDLYSKTVSKIGPKRTNGDKEKKGKRKTEDDRSSKKTRVKETKDKVSKKMKKAKYS